MMASQFIRRIQKAIDKHGDLPIQVDWQYIKSMRIQKVGPYSKDSSKDVSGKKFLEVFFNGDKGVGINDTQT